MSVKFRVIFILLAILLVSFNGCLKKSITDRQIIDAVQAFIDNSPDPENDKSLTAEEKAAVEKYEIYRNIIKVQLIEGTPGEMWQAVGSKIVEAFAIACRDATVFEVQYICELRIISTDDDGKFNALVGEIQYENNSGRVRPSMYSPRRN